MKRLFIVEDEAIIAMDLAEQLEEFGFDVVGVAHDGESAIEQLQDLDPELILMDIVLGNGIDGIETAEEILKSRSIPVIFLTAFSDKNTVERAAKVAPYGYITKPYNAQALRASIEIALTKHQLEHKLLYKERWFSHILHAVHDGIIAVGIDGLIHFANAEACRLLEVSGVDELIRKDVSELIQLYDQNGTALTASPVASAMQRNAVMPIVFNGSVKNINTGHRIFIDFSAAPVRGAANRVIGGLLALRDASHRLQIESEIRKSDGRFQAAFNNSSVGVGLVSLNGGLIEHNSAFSELFDLPQVSDINITEALSLSYNDRTKIQEGHLSLLSGQVSSFQHELKVQLKESHIERWLMINISLLHDKESNPSYYFYQIYDLTDRKRAEQKLYHLANYDALTGLMNLPQVKDEITHIIELNEYDQNGIAVITIDIDDFDGINDQYGVAVGDHILTELATRLNDLGHYNLAIGRLGGDRFVLIMHSLESVNQAMFITNRALDELKEPIFVDDQELLVTACAGIAIGPDDGITADTLLNASASALQLAKVNGRGQIHFYNEDVVENVKGRINNEIRITSALADGRLTCQFLKATPVSSDCAQTIIKVLVYWEERDYFLTPDSFFNIANYSGLSRNLLLAVVEKVCSELKNSKDTDKPVVIIPFYPAILQSAELVKDVAVRIRSYGLEPCQFVFGLTGRLMTDGKAASLKINEIKQEGFQFCLNLFNGQSASVDLLYNFAPEYCEFALTDDQPNLAIYLDATMAMTQALKIPVILCDDRSDKRDSGLKDKATYLLPDRYQAIDLGTINKD